MDLANIPQYVQVALGIGLVIFVHELGHFLAARWCKVRVHVFSLGFGPRLFAWRRGHTTFQIAAVPLGGYVRMAGDETLGQEGRAPEPWELGAKSVPQRFLIYSGGVLMNLLFGIVVFPILFLLGLPSVEPVIGEVEPGSPAWFAEVEPGTRVLAVNDREIYDLTHVAAEVAYGGSDTVELELLAPGESEPATLRLEPEYDERVGVYSVGTFFPSPAEGLALRVAEDSSAQDAGVREGDRLLGVAGQPSNLSPQQQFQFAVLEGGPVELLLERDGEELRVVVPPREAQAGARMLMGVRPVSNLVEAVRPSESTRAVGLRAGDRVLSVGGTRVHEGRELLAALLAAEGPLTWILERDGREVRSTSPVLDESEAVALYEDLAFESDMNGTEVVVLPGSAAERVGFRSGDRIERIDGVAVEKYMDISEAAGRAGGSDRSMQVAFSRWSPDGERELLDLEVSPGPYRPVQYGVALEPARYDYRVTNGFKAIALGTVACYDMLRDVWRTLRGVLTREVSEKNIGSIITIGVIANHTAEAGMVKFFWFLCLLSINLAFLNVLPIPLLDGGHLFFLLVEGIKGSPVSERILSYSQLVGLVLIVSIFVFVIYNDLTMHVFN